MYRSITYDNLHASFAQNITQAETENNCRFQFKEQRGWGQETDNIILTHADLRHSHNRSFSVVRQRTASFSSDAGLT